jgi:hypothetical protein
MPPELVQADAQVFQYIRSLSHTHNLHESGQLSAISNWL